jgi:NarL family two-component system response regulator YdfI
VAAESERARAEVGASLRGDDRLEVVGETPLLTRARNVAALDPDVLVEVRDRPGDPAPIPTVVLADEPHLVWTAEAFDRGGARAGFAVLGSGASPDELVAAVVAVAAGLVATQPATLARGRITSPQVLENERLSPREVDVLAELARGAPNKHIAGRLGISEHTVKFHISSIFAKLGVSSRTEAVTRGVRLGLIML